MKKMVMLLDDPLSLSHSLCLAMVILSSLIITQVEGSNAVIDHTIPRGTGTATANFYGAVILTASIPVPVPVPVPHMEPSPCCTRNLGGVRRCPPSNRRVLSAKGAIEATTPPPPPPPPSTHGAFDNRTPEVPESANSEGTAALTRPGPVPPSGQSACTRIPGGVGRCPPSTRRRMLSVKGASAITTPSPLTLTNGVFHHRTAAGTGPGLGSASTNSEGRAALTRLSYIARSGQSTCSHISSGVRRCPPSTRRRVLFAKGAIEATTPPPPPPPSTYGAFDNRTSEVPESANSEGTATLTRLGPVPRSGPSACTHIPGGIGRCPP